MVVPLGPGKFYGSSLPRPRFYTDVKFNSERVDPPATVLDPLLLWANEAHWSMGGLSFNRLRLQGRIEGNVQRPRAQRETAISKQSMSSMSPKVEYGKGRSGRKRNAASLSPPPAPIAAKRRRYMAMIDDDENEEEVEEKLVLEESEDEGDEPEESEQESEEEEEEPVRVVNKKKPPARKLDEEFDRVADKRRSEVKRVVPDLNREHSEGDEAEGSPRKGKKIVLKSGSGRRIRTSPKLTMATESLNGSGGEIRTSPRLTKAAEDTTGSAGGIRTSPRLAKAADRGPVSIPKTHASRRLVKRG